MKSSLIAINEAVEYFENVAGWEDFTEKSVNALHAAFIECGSGPHDLLDIINYLYKNDDWYCWTIDEIKHLEKARQIYNLHNEKDN